MPRITLNWFNLPKLRIGLMVGLFMVGGAVFAQTPVPIEVDTNALFSSANDWIAIFTPIVAIGVGIAIALAILSFIGKQIVDAFR